jgi:hypothetical protein
MDNTNNPFVQPSTWHGAQVKVEESVSWKPEAEAESHPEPVAVQATVFQGQQVFPDLLSTDHDRIAHTQFQNKTEEASSSTTQQVHIQNEQSAPYSYPEPTHGESLASFKESLPFLTASLLRKTLAEKAGGKPVPRKRNRRRPEAVLIKNRYTELELLCLVEQVALCSNLLLGPRVNTNDPAAVAARQECWEKVR